MRWLVTGAGGMLGHDLLDVLPSGVTAVRRSELDITDADAVAAAVAGHDVVVNAAAWTDVDGAEADEAAATRVNGTGAETLALACAKTGARLIHVSTDYVFAGDATEPYPEDGPINPINAYGRSKLAGERAVLETLPETGYVVRTAWLYGRHGKNFVTTMLRLARERETLDVVDDQLGQPTWTGDLAAQIVALLDADAPAGIYHGTNAGQASWYEFARAVFAQAGLDPERVKPTDSSTFVRPAPRPSYSVLGHDGWARAGLEPMRPWEDALAAATTDGLFAEH
jgi:dTDP-4-dehydrorhamnose reductase